MQWMTYTWEYIRGSLEDLVDTNIVLHLSWLAYLIIASLASVHILLNKRDSKAAAAWIGVVWLSPYLGTLFYISFGINRIARKGALIREEKYGHAEIQTEVSGQVQGVLYEAPFIEPQGGKLHTYLNKIAHMPIVTADDIRILGSGEMAYPAMLAAIEGAQKYVYLSTYIFERGVWGDKFIDSLARAKDRGLEVKVLIDAIGSRYSFPTVFGKLRKKNISFRKFLPNFSPWNVAFLNLRNHRKILVIDGMTAYTGGMNIRDKHMQSEGGVKFTNDLQFQFTGHIVDQFTQVFAEDWRFAAKEKFQVPNQKIVRRSVVSSSRYHCRVVTDGPDIDFEKIKWAFLGAIANAKKNINIVTPYFLPESTIVDALCVASLNGVRVRIIVPKKGNIALLNWAMMPQFRQLLANQCEIFLQLAPFDHSKLMTIDGYWSFIGSSNWDSRSLRLNFEMNVEVYSKLFAAELDEVFYNRLARSNLLSMDMLNARSMMQKIRDNAARLLAPYL